MNEEFQAWIETEKAFLAAFLLAEGEVRIDAMTPECFAEPRNRAIFKASLGVLERGEKPDPITVMQELEWTGRKSEVDPSYLAGIAMMGISGSVAGAYGEMVIRNHCRRKLLSGLKTAVQMAENDGADTHGIIAMVEREFDTIRTKSAAGVVPIGAFSGVFDQRLEDIAQGKSGIIGLPTGFAELDALTCGLCNGDFIVIAARPAMGKTALAMEILYHTAACRKPGIFVSLEMSGNAIYSRLACSRARVDLKKFRAGFLSKSQIGDLRGASAKIAEVPVFLADSAQIGSERQAIHGVIRRAVKSHGAGLAVVDYLQLMRIAGHRGNRETEVSTLSRGLKELAKELDIPIVALSQLSRECEKRDDKRPRMSDLRESGAIEQDVDLLIGLYRDEYYRKDTRDRGIAEAVVMKQRNGPTGTVKLQFDAAFARFGNLDLNRKDHQAAETDNEEEDSW